MEYSQLSDFEINKRVADIVMNGTWHVRPSHPGNTTGGWLYGSNGIQTHDLPDYCRNPADAWPIITENKISIYAMSEADARGKWGVEAFYPNEAYHFDDNPLRAAMIVFLMMQDANHA